MIIQPIIKLQEVHKSYKLGKVQIVALSSINLTIAPGKFVTIMGPSGSGKSTLLHILGLLDKPDNGLIEIEGQSIQNCNDAKLTSMRRENIGIIFQHYNLIPIFNVYENIEYPLLHSRISIGNRKKRVKEIASIVGIEDLLKRFPNELSGGQQQRVAIARALIREPKILIADEPTANLDSKNGEIVIDVLMKLNILKRITVILSTHNPSIGNLGSTIINLCDGRLVAIDERKLSAPIE